MRLFVPYAAAAMALVPSGAFARTTLATGSTPDIPWLRIVLSFLLCLALAVAAILAVRAYRARGFRKVQTLFGAQRGRRDSAIEIIETRRIAPHTDLCVVQFSGETLLLSISREGVSLIARTPTAGDLEDESATQGRS